MNLCTFCKVNEGTMIHSRRWRVRTNDHYTRYKCRDCQSKRVARWNKSNEPQIVIQHDAVNNNDLIMGKYANAS